MTYLAVPIAAKDLAQAKKQIKAARAGGAEMLELRTDYLENLSVDLVKSLIAEAGNAAKQSLPVIVTCRDEKQGGAIAYPDKLRVDVLAGALKAGAEFIDFEYENFLSAENQERIKLALSQGSKGRLILSAHNFETNEYHGLEARDTTAKMAVVLNKLYRTILAVYPAAIPKLVYRANHINDCFEAFDLLHQSSGERIVFCMGDAGLVSRIIAKKLNSFVTFASIDEKTATAPGQLTIEQFKKLYRYDFINTGTCLYGIIGSPVAHSLSPAIHNACFGRQGINAVYLPLLVEPRPSAMGGGEGGKEQFGEFMEKIVNRSWLGFAGFSVTIPHKANALNYVREKQGFIEPLAAKIGAANTIVVGPDGKLGAYNTDYAGALDAITSAPGIKKDDLKNMTVAVVGAGGVARAIVAGLTDAGAQITIYNRTVKKGKKLAAEFGCDFASLEKLPSVNAKLLINCTSVGMYPNVDATPLPKECIKKDMVVFDAVYNPQETLLLKYAKQRGAKTIDGLSMFINQAMAQFKLFTGQNANPKLMRKTICNRLSCR